MEANSTTFLTSPKIICSKTCNLARSANLPEGQYILPMFFLYFLIFFNGRLRSLAGSEANGPIFTKISELVDRCKGLITPLSFFDFSRDVAMATY